MKRNPLVAAARAARSNESDQYYQSYMAPYNQAGGPDFPTYRYHDPNHPQEIATIEMEAKKKRNLDMDLDNWRIAASLPPPSLPKTKKVSSLKRIEISPNPPDSKSYCTKTPEEAKRMKKKHLLPFRKNLLSVPI